MDEFRKYPHWTRASSGEWAVCVPGSKIKPGTNIVLSKKDGSIQSVTITGYIEKSPYGHLYYGDTSDSDRHMLLTEGDGAVSKSSFIVSFIISLATLILAFVVTGFIWTFLLATTAIISGIVGIVFFSVYRDGVKSGKATPSKDNTLTDKTSNTADEVKLSPKASLIMSIVLWAVALLCVFIAVYPDIVGTLGTIGFLCGGGFLAIGGYGFLKEYKKSNASNGSLKD